MKKFDVEINLVSQFSDTEPVEAETLVNCVQCNNVFNTRHGLSVHIGKVHKISEPLKLKIGYPHKSGNEVKDYTMIATRYEPFQCITVARDIPEELEVELKSDQKPLVAILLHSEGCWHLSGQALLCPDRPDIPPGDHHHAGHPYVDKTGAHLPLKSSLCDEVDSEYTTIN